MARLIFLDSLDFTNYRNYLASSNHNHPEPMKATFLKDVSSAFHGTAKVFRLDPPMTDYDDNEHAVILVSAVTALEGPEVYLFPSTEGGNVTDWGQLPESRKGTLDIDAVLEEAGYTIETGGTG